MFIEIILKILKNDNIKGKVLFVEYNLKRKRIEIYLEGKKLIFSLNNFKVEEKRYDEEIILNKTRSLNDKDLEILSRSLEDIKKLESKIFEEYDIPFIYLTVHPSKEGVTIFYGGKYVIFISQDSYTVLNLFLLFS